MNSNPFHLTAGHRPRYKTCFSFCKSITSLYFVCVWKENLLVLAVAAKQHNVQDLNFTLIKENLPLFRTAVCVCVCVCFTVKALSLQFVHDRQMDTHKPTHTATANQRVFVSLLKLQSGIESNKTSRSSCVFLCFGD